MNQDTVTIVQITAGRGDIFGLGSDGMVYLWNGENHTWRLWN